MDPDKGCPDSVNWLRCSFLQKYDLEDYIISGTQFGDCSGPLGAENGPTGSYCHEAIWDAAYKERQDALKNILRTPRDIRTPILGRG